MARPATPFFNIDSEVAKPDRFFYSLWSQYAKARPGLVAAEVVMLWHPAVWRKNHSDVAVAPKRRNWSAGDLARDWFD